MEEQKIVKDVINYLKSFSAFAPVSVVVPCYNNEKTIERAVFSVAGQSWRPEELILIDDNSSDRTLAVINKAKEKIGGDWIRVISLPKNHGPSICRNRGWDESRQKYVAFLDADDFWNKDKIAIQAYYMIKNENIVLNGHKFLYCAENKNYDFSELRFSEITIKEIEKTKWMFRNYYSVPGVMIKKNFPYRFLPFKNYSEDYFLWLSIAFDGFKMTLLDLPLAYGSKRYFWEKGLSKNTWRLEKGEIDNFFRLFKEKKVGFLLAFLAVSWSLLKYLRIVILKTLKG